MEWWTAIGTMALAIIAFVQFWVQFYFSAKQSRDTREAVQKTIDAQGEVSREDIALRLYLNMEDRFDGFPMQQRRHELAYHLMNKGSMEQTKEDVLNFFEDLGTLLKQGRVNEQLTYDTFSYHAKGWWFACQPYIMWLRARKKDSSMFSDFELLAEKMMERETKERGISREAVNLSAAEIDEFIKEEYMV